MTIVVIDILVGTNLKLEECVVCFGNSGPLFLALVTLDSTIMNFLIPLPHYQVKK